MDAYTLELKKLLADHQAPQVMKSLMDTLGEASQYSQTLKAEIEPLQSEIIMLSSRLTRINKDREQNLIDQNNFGIELARFEKSILGILNGLDENYPGLEKYFQEREEDAAWATASAANDIEAYKAFFTKYPHGKYREETQRLIQKLEALEVKKNIAFKKTAEAERQRRQQITTNKKPRDGTLKYILIAVGIFAGIAGLYFLVQSFNSSKAKPSRSTVATSKENPSDILKEVEEIPEKKIEVKEVLTASTKDIIGTWKSAREMVKIKTNGNRVYGEVGNYGLIEGAFDPRSQIVKGELIEGNKKVPFLWELEGWTLRGKETWVLTDKQAKRNLEKFSSKEPLLSHFLWAGTWKTNKGTAQFSQKGNKVTGSLRGTRYNTGKIEATYNSSTRKLIGKIYTSPFPANFEIIIKGKETFSGSGNFTEVKLVPVLTKTGWQGNKIK